MSTNISANPNESEELLRLTRLLRGSGHDEGITQNAEELPKTDSVQTEPPNLIVMPVAQRRPIAVRTDNACTLPKGVSFKGKASFACDVQIDGTFEGDLVASQGSSATISAGATFTGNITATNITIDGHAHGSVDASAGVARFGAASTCTGNVLYGRLAIAEGAEIEATTKKARPQ